MLRGDIYIFRDLHSGRPFIYQWFIIIMFTIHYGRVIAPPAGSFEK